MIAGLSPFLICSSASYLKEKYAIDILAYCGTFVAIPVKSD